jgi:hypothetical protein
MRGLGMNKKKIEKLLDNLTLGLKADPEIRLDVKSELRSHLDAKIEEGIQAGLSEKESEKQALKAFGDTIQISDGIADANTAKMSLKAKLKVFAGFLLIPAVIICALISFEHSILGVALSLDTLAGPTVYLNALSRNKNKVFWSLQRYTPEEKLILYGDKSKKSKVEQQKAIWERFPENKIYLANYILTLFGEKKHNDNWRKKMFPELKLAKQKDPDNALYNYITAGLLLQKACTVKSKHIKTDKKNKKYKAEYFIKIKDRKLMDQAVEEYLKGTRKKHFKTYAIEMLHKRLDIMGEPKNVLENLNQIGVAASMSLPYLNYQRNTSRAIWIYAGILQKEGKQQEALKIVSPWKTYIKQITKDSNILICILVNIAIAEFGEQKIPEVYQNAGKFKLSQDAKRSLASIISVKKKWKADIKKYHINHKQIAKAGALARMLLPALGKVDFTEEDFTVSKKIEYTAVEKAGVVLLNTLFMFAMICGGLTALYWRLRSKQKALLLTPPLQLVGKVFLLGIILPLTAYTLISISGIVGGHEYNIIYNVINLGAQFIILLAVIPTIIFMLIRKHIHQRCLELGISCPKIKQSKVWRIILIIIFSILVIIALLPVNIMSRSSLTMTTIVIGLSTLCILILYIFILIAEYFTTIFSGKQYALYYGALAKTLTPIFALAMIFMTLTIIPYLDWCEADLISKDKVVYGQPKSFTHAEYQVTQRLKAAILKALE